MKLTVRDRLIAALKLRGYKEVESRSYKYVTMTKDHCSYYFIGKAGALRKGRIVTDSVPVERFKRELLTD